MAAVARTVRPLEVNIEGVVVLPRGVHHDPRGFLVETLREDDAPVRGNVFAMSYISLTLPGEKRDRDRWHVHKNQMDRFVVLAGEMILALYDSRPESPTKGTLTLVRMIGAQEDWSAVSPGTKRDATTYMVTIPIGVYHCIGNLSGQPFLLQNYPTRLYDPKDEGRVPFTEVPVKSLGNRPFAWDSVEVLRP